MARKLRTTKGNAAYSRRKVIVEPVFGQMKTTQGAGSAPAPRPRARPRGMAPARRLPQPSKAVLLHHPSTASPVPTGECGFARTHHHGDKSTPEDLPAGVRPSTQEIAYRPTHLGGLWIQGEGGQLPEPSAGGER